jgi:glycopeptide antibiotics resistance protein
MFFSVSVLFLYSFDTEVLQGLMNPICHRVFEWRDLFQNVLGVLLGTVIGHFCRPVVSCR